ncbi:MAG TPA: choice-of-anchor D domain-containing protein [Burkholderiaceae bacterium]|nr:choice-of-anchor D domain-containing protein [Burkholderiaceae bacterium]
MKKVRWIVGLVAVLTALGVTPPSNAADPVRGKALFSSTNGAPKNCADAACHSGFPSVARNSIQKGTSASVILNAISGDKGGMRVLSPYVGSTEANDIAAYIANPSAGSGAPAIALSVTSLSFVSQTLNTTSAAQTVTVSNTGTAVLNLSGLTISGAAGAEFARGGTCQVGTNVAVGGNCSITVTFTPTAAGARNATLTVTHNASGGSSAVALAGTGALAPAVAGVAPSTLSFTQTVNSTSTSQAVTVSNTGGQPLTLGAIGIAGANAADFMIAAGSTCATGTVVNAGANCALQVAFRPAATGARSATLSIGHSAAASPATVTLTGTGTASPQPAVSLSVTSLDLGTVSLGARSAAKTITLTNSGQAALTLAGLALGGPAGGDFTRAGTCASAMSVAPSGTCTIDVVFAPGAVGARAGTLTVTSDASNGTPVVALSGTGVQYSIAVSPAAASMQSTVGVVSAAVQVTVTNTGGSPIQLSSIAVTGPFVMQQGSNACGATPLDMAPGVSCNVYLAFLPAAPGAASGELIVTSASLANPTRVALSADARIDQAGAPTAPSGSQSSTSPSLAATVPASSAVAPANAGGGGCTVGPIDQLVDPTLALMLGIAVLALARRRR